MEYYVKHKGSKKLNTKILFSESTTNAGDSLVKNIINKIVVPYIINGIDNAELRMKAMSVLNDTSFLTNKNFLVSVVKSVFLPLVNKWLSGLTKDGIIDPRKQQPWALSDCGIDQEILEAFNAEIVGERSSAKILNEYDPIEINFSELEKIVLDWSKEMAETHARFLATFQCDLVIATGKPSEIKPIRDTLYAVLPIDPCRVFFAKGYYAGGWLPLGGSSFEDKNKIQDAKLVTATGCALSIAMQKELLLDQFAIERDDSDDEGPIANWWYTVTENGDLDQCILSPYEDEKSMKLNKGAIIARVRFPGSAPQRVYLLQRSDDDPGRYESMTVSFKRVNKWPEGDYLINERLELVSVVGREISEQNGRQGQDIQLDNYILALNTLGGEYWLDNPKFDVSSL